MATMLVPILRVTEMNLEQWALIAEIVGGLAIAISLIYVAIEVQQNTLAQKASIYQTMSQDVRAITSSLPYQTRMKLRQGEVPSRLEEVEYVNWSASTMRIYESWWKQHPQIPATARSGRTTSEG